MLSGGKKFVIINHLPGVTNFQIFMAFPSYLPHSSLTLEKKFNSTSNSYIASHLAHI